MNIVLETPRLLLREFLISDAECFYNLSNDSDVQAYTGDPSFPSIDEAEAFLHNYFHYKQYGYGRWAVVHKENQEFLGWCGLQYEDSIRKTDLGFRFFKPHWGKGYATEAGRSCIDYGFSKLNLDRIIGRVMKGNLASIHVLEKCGMQFIREMEFELHPGLLYEIVKP